MRRCRRFMFTLLVMFAFGAIGTAIASAEGSPSLLSLEGKIEQLEGKFILGASEWSVLKGEKIIESAEGAATEKNCKKFETSESDTRLCGGTIDFNKVKIKGSTNCRSETAAGEKDPVETVLVLVNIHMASELSQAKILEPLMILLILVEDNKDLILNCGLIKALLLGSVPCLLLPGLKEILANEKKWEIVCETDATVGILNGDQLTGTCLQLCETLTEEPLATSFLKEGEKETDSAWLVKAIGSFNKDLIAED